MTQPSLPHVPPASPEDHRQHLDFIQACIARMSSSCAVAKGWALTVATAAYGYAGTKGSSIVALLGMVAVILFAILDARYLREERRYRVLYNAARSGQVSSFDMDANALCQTVTGPARDYVSWGKVVRSWSVRDFYGTTFLVGVALLVWLHCWD